MNSSEDIAMERHREATKKSVQTVLSVAERNQVPIFIAVPIFVVVKRQEDMSCEEAEVKLSLSKP